MMECMNCNYSGEFVGNSMVCPHCLQQNAISVKREHIRICYCCFRVDKVSTAIKARAKFCRSCSSRIRMTKDVKDLVRYRSNCETCGKERVLKAPATSKVCKMCSFEASKKKREYSRTCNTCGKTETVRTIKASNNPICHECQKNKRNAARYRGDGTGKKAKKTYTPVGTDGAKRNKVTVKFQIVDEKTMEAPVKKRDKKELPQLDEDVSKRMQQEWINNPNNKIKVG